MTISALAFFSKSGSAGTVTGTFTITSSAPSTDTVVLSLMSPDVYTFASPTYQITNVPIIAGKATGTFTGLSAGTYGVRADDQAGGGATQAFFDAVVTISGAAASAPNDPTDITVSAQTETSAGLIGVADLTGTTPMVWELQSSAIGGPGAGDWAGTGSQAGNTWTVTPGTTVGTYRRIRAGAGGLWSGWYYEQIGYLNPVEGGGGALDDGSGSGSGLTGLSISPASVARAQTGTTVQFTLSGLVSGSPVSPLPASWSVMSGSGSIDSNGLLTVGSLGGSIVVRATPSADPSQSITATVLEVTKDMDDVSLQSLSYQGGILTGTILFNTTPGRVKITATYGGRTDEAIFGPGLTVPIAWNVGVQEQQVKFLAIGLPAS